MSLWWNEASYYTHGWGVPLLALVLLAKRLPETHAENRQTKEPGLTILFLPALLFLFFRFVGEPDPFWRLPLWGEMIFLSLLSGLFFHLQKAPIRWQTCLLAGIYLMTALPWPAGIETKVVHGLTNLISQLTTEIILLSGFPAEMVGNSIRVDQQEITINQACSGIRSLQNLLSFAVFLLIYFRFDALRSCFLFGLAGATALLCNLCRALTLSFVFLNYGESTQVSWHDTIGNFYVILSMALMFLYAWYVKPAEKLDKHPLPSENYRPPPSCYFPLRCIWMDRHTNYPAFSYPRMVFLSLPSSSLFCMASQPGHRSHPVGPRDSSSLAVRLWEPHKNRINRWFARRCDLLWVRAGLRCRQFMQSQPPTRLLHGIQRDRINRLPFRDRLSLQ